VLEQFNKFINAEKAYIQKKEEDERAKEEEKDEDKIGKMKKMRKKEDKKRQDEEELWTGKFKTLLSTTLKLGADGAKNYPHLDPDAQTKRVSRDLGCLAGLMLAGVQGYIHKSGEDLQSKMMLCNLFIDATSGLLTGVPVAGFLFGPVGSITKHAAQKLFYKEPERKILYLGQAIKQHFDEFIAGPIFFDGKFVFKPETPGGKEEPKQVEWWAFSKWYEQVISWNQLALKLTQ
jgi:hypothetical protein